jgi:hypothetical protein
LIEIFILPVKHSHLTAVLPHIGQAECQVQVNVVTEKVEIVPKTSGTIMRSSRYLVAPLDKAHLTSTRTGMRKSANPIPTQAYISFRFPLPGNNLACSRMTSRALALAKTKLNG